MEIKNKTLIDMIKRNNNYFEDYITRSVGQTVMWKG